MVVIDLKIFKLERVFISDSLFMAIAGQSQGSDRRKDSRTYKVWHYLACKAGFASMIGLAGSGFMPNR